MLALELLISEHAVNHATEDRARLTKGRFNLFRPESRYNARDHLWTFMTSLIVVVKYLKRDVH